MRWKRIKDFPNYKISEDGRVKRVVANARGRFKNRIMQQVVVDFSGHRIVHLRRDGDNKRYTRTVQQLLARAFHGRRPKHHEAAHLDGNPSHNHYTNIAWKTRQGNSHDRYVHGTHAIGSKNGRAILTKQQTREIKLLLRNKYHGIFRQLGRKYGVSDSTIHAIDKGRSWNIRLSERIANRVI